ncbi:MAG: bifunctional 4-hydroxy-2-oxoglutarate aldolase/2-dehydro-3-deoxy-phosphogluconate aldolase [Nitrospinota bacterium]|nr:MAG: bifunctional 4-hydroxy-2-oxoglutarate aldolase/2-dehydro-3-deoxy-phosphogluconate aldolase [Nitrospinota bacterium]
MSLLQRILEQKLVAVVRAESAALAIDAAQAAFQGGIVLLEIAFTVPQAEEAISRLRKQLPQAVIGAGSITTPDQAEAALQAGAEFFVSPHTDPQLLQWFQQRQLFYMPGGLTPSELMAAWKAGCAVQKFFPASVGGPAMLRAILQPLPFLRPLASGGVDEQNALAFLQAGAAALNVGGSLFRKSYLQQKDWKAIESASARLVQLCKGA